MTIEQKILDRIGYKAWINHPSTLQRLHRFHGQTGWVIPNEHGESVFHFAVVPTVVSAIEIVVVDSEVSRGWPIATAADALPSSAAAR